MPCTIFVPRGNSREKNAAMQAFGAELVVAGADFDECRPHAAQLAEERGYHFVPSFHADLVKGVATYALELFQAVPDLDAVYAPIGMGSGICGLITVRDLLGLKTDIIGVVADKAPAVALSFEQGRPVPTNSAATFADGMACRDAADGCFRPDSNAERVACEVPARAASALCVSADWTRASRMIAAPSHTRIISDRISDPGQASTPGSAPACSARRGESRPRSRFPRRRRRRVASRSGPWRSSAAAPAQSRRP